MKKLCALILALSMILLCACSGDGGNKGDETTAPPASEQMNETTTKKTFIYAENWGTDLLPEDFPPPPPETHALFVSSGSANSSYASDWVKLKFTCPEHQFYAFTNALNENGYAGGVKNIKSAAYYSEGFNGLWQNGKTFVQIGSSALDVSGEYVFNIYVFDCKNNTPRELTQFFPIFDGYSRNSGYFNGYNGSTLISESFNGNFDAEFWFFDFSAQDSFAGVSQSEFEAYGNELADYGFSGQVSNTTVDGCSIILLDMLSPDGDFGVFVSYNQILKSLEIIYTNNSAYFLTE